MASEIRDERWATAILSWVAGFVDTAGFLRLNGLFTAHVTGNLVVAGAQLAGATEQSVWVRLAVIPVFIVAVIFTSIIARPRVARLSMLLWLEVAALLLFAGVGIILVAPNQQPVDNLTLFIVGSTGVFAMGIRNALMRESLPALAPTTVMTGNLTQFVIACTRLYFMRGAHQTPDLNTQVQEVRQTVAKFASALIGFVLGAAFGAFFMQTTGFWSILLPAFATASLAVDTQRHQRQI